MATDLMALLDQDVKAATVAATTVRHGGTVPMENLPDAMRPNSSTPSPAAAANPTTKEDTGDPACCVRISSNAKMMMLTLRRENGEQLQVPYASIHYTYMPSPVSTMDNLHIYAAGYEITIIGTNLAFLAERLAQWRVFAINQTGQPHAATGMSIRALLWDPVQPDKKKA
jgi:hypothetical protein